MVSKKVSFNINDQENHEGARRFFNRMRELKNDRETTQIEVTGSIDRFCINKDFFVVIFGAVFLLIGIFIGYIL